MYIGNEPQTQSLTHDLFSGDGSTVDFTLTHSPGSATAIIVSVGGILQVASQGYTVSGGTLTFTSAPPTGTNNISVVHLGVEVQIPTPADGTVTQSKINTGSLNPIVQIVRTDDGEVATGTTIFPSDDTIPQNTEGDEYLSVTITPKSATNKLIIESSCLLSHSVAAAQMALGLFQDSVVDCLAVSAETFPNLTNRFAVVSINHEMIAGTTSAITFKIRAGASSAGTTTFNGFSGARRYGGVVNSYIKVTEVMQ